MYVWNVEKKTGGVEQRFWSVLDYRLFFVVENFFAALWEQKLQILVLRNYDNN